MADALAEGQTSVALTQAALSRMLSAGRAPNFGDLKARDRKKSVCSLSQRSVAAYRGAIASLPAAWALDRDVDRHPTIFATMTGSPAAEGVPPLQPDIVGEHFALGYLSDPKLPDALRHYLITAAWAINPFGTADSRPRPSQHPSFGDAGFGSEGRHRVS